MIICRTVVRNVVLKLLPPKQHTTPASSLAALLPSERESYLRKMALPKSREEPVIMKLDSLEFKSIFTDELTGLVSIFKEFNYDIRVAGGAVRDLLMGMKPKDLDFATTATPDQMKSMFDEKKVRMINTKGEKHGTITARINDKENFEVTTLRIDVVTDGRHAEVQFTTDWLLDALRRDLTINSMFLGLDGSVYDYFYGYDDLKKRRMAFVGDAVQRIQEDYLRILRYFRFYGRIALESNKHEESTLKAIRDNVGGLKNISGERIWVEFKKILEGNFAGDLLLTMLDVGIGAFIGLPDKPNTEEFKKVCERTSNLKPQAITLLTSLLNTQEQVLALHDRLKFSNYDRDLALFIVEHREAKPNPKPMLPYQQLLIKTKYKVKDVREWIIEVLKYNNSPFLGDFEAWEAPKFPVNGAMLKEAGVEAGKLMGLVMNELRHIWADSEFSLSAEELLQQVPHIREVLSNKRKK